MWFINWIEYIQKEIGETLKFQCLRDLMWKCLIWCDCSWFDVKVFDIVWLSCDCSWFDVKVFDIVWLSCDCSRFDSINQIIAGV